MDGQSYLLLIRDEGGPPELQVGDAYVLRPLLTLFCWRDWRAPGKGPAWLPFERPVVGCGRTWGLRGLRRGCPYGDC